MADKHYEIVFELSDGGEKTVEFTAPQGPAGKNGTDGKRGNGVYIVDDPPSMNPEENKLETTHEDMLQIGDVIYCSIDNNMYKVINVISSGAAFVELVGNIRGDNGETGQRGTGLLPVTTAPSSYTTAIGDITPKYRMAISTIKTQAGVTEVLLGDTVRYSYYHYPIAYLDASYAYFTTRVSIRGATGAAYTLTDADKNTIAAAVKDALPTLTVTGIDADGVSHSWTMYGVAQ